MQGELFSANNLLVLIIILALNGCSSRNKPAPVVDVQGSLPLSQRLKNSVSGSEYIVKKGETLYSIAWRADIDIRTLANINNIKAPYNIYPQQKLMLTKSKFNAKLKNYKSKGFNTSKQKVIKKPIAQKKKQEYGKNVADQKSSKKVQQHTAFSQKISKWQWPAKGRVIHKFSSAKQGNKGIDIAGRHGDSVKATANGKVVYAGDALQGYGKLVIVKHNEDYLSAYAHNDRILVKEQQVVKAGQVIAKMGDTDAERVMLHFEVRFRGKSVNPMKYLPK
ncbi:peptidoglycan DD-metalloendopeptidase family protein [Colwellia sp. C1TZA3]|uniref:peptidoglycan DD-metalloendopeptidase family protein n=1 Tax=Colwellia sp. C1TZA3 TaxID=2508879 RepID=UPI0011B95BE3|nr:peptidoglycan DD-metalloendopeptidase family protein [Colwellia sp. C1TZA3]TWX73480.1 peptidoglycan DD-metalloendopeptidase family protein [Colwellia sp. C1TZA3]